MSDIAIKVENLSKCYRIGAKEKKNERFGDVVASWIKTPITNFRNLHNLDRFNDNGFQEDVIWALKDVSFEVKHGEILGIIGENGAGKSTLLKILSRITDPTNGTVDIYGRVASLLEVGTGFNTELTGRENVYLNGTILGMSKGEVNKKFDEIVDFSGIEKFIDTPVKRYSSGMSVRLGFAVAAHLEPEILLVDEVLAVGDQEFQRKCLGKMKDIMKQDRTIIFISHNMSSIQSLCNDVILLQNGCEIIKGPASKVIDDYLRYSVSSGGEYVWNEANENEIENNKILPISLHIRDHTERVVSELTSTQPFQIEFQYQLVQSIADLHVGITLKTTDEQWICLSFDHDEVDNLDSNRQPGRYQSRCTIPENLLNDHTYILGIQVTVPNKEMIYSSSDLIQFSVHTVGGVGSSMHCKRPGVVKPLFNWKTQRITAS